MRVFAAIVVLLLSLSTPAMAEKRVALIIGNSNYSAVTPLENAVNDASLLAQTLEPLGFDVTLITDTSQDDLKRAVSDFGKALRAGGPDTVGLFYYAGHGVQSFGANYLLPVDASLNVAADLDLVGLEAATVLRQMASARNRTNIVILDACRNNPFEDIPDMNDNGLAEMKAPTGTYLAYATAPGAVALDGDGRNSPFTAALVDAVQTEGVPIERVFKNVRVSVIDQTRGAQTPWDTSSLTREFVFRPTKALTSEEIEERQLWRSVEASRDPVQVMLFLRSYPEGQFATEARAMLGNLMAEELRGEGDTQTAQTPEPAPQPPAVAPAPQDEATLMEAARASGTLEDYQAYLDAYPNGIFSELVKIELAAIRAKASEDPDGPPPVAEPIAKAPAVPEPEDAPVVLFNTPLAQGVQEIIGKTIMEVAQSSPLYAPIEGIPESMWKGQVCSNCHQWDRDTLCDQAQFYQRESASRSLQKEHPFGGTFKRNLKHWAENGCQ